MDVGLVANNLHLSLTMFSTTDPTHSVSAIATAAISGTARCVLHRIRDTEINLALWERTLPAEAADFCAKLAVRSSALDLDVTGAPDSILLLAATALFTRVADHAPVGPRGAEGGAGPVKRKLSNENCQIYYEDKSAFFCCSACCQQHRIQQPGHFIFVGEFCAN
jgi:hypothetical protein